MVLLLTAAAASAAADGLHPGTVVANPYCILTLVDPFSTSRPGPSSGKRGRSTDTCTAISGD